MLIHGTELTNARRRTLTDPFHTIVSLRYCEAQPGLVYKVREVTGVVQRVSCLPVMDKPTRIHIEGKGKE